MKYLWSVIIITCTLCAMEDEARKMNQEILQRKATRIKHKTQHYLTHVPLKEQLSHPEFRRLTKLCTFTYAPLMMRLLEAKIVKPNTDCCGQTLFMESIRCHRHEVKEMQETSLDLVRGFLKAGAKSDGISSVTVGSETKSYRPLKYAAHYLDLDLVTLLLNANADPSCDDVMLYTLDAYCTRCNDKTADHQKEKEASLTIIERLLEKGADLSARCYLPHHKMVTSPYEFVQLKGLRDLVTAFDEQIRRKNPPQAP